MKSIFTPDEMRSIDRAATEQFGIAPALLMENAARSACEILSEIFKKHNLLKPSVLILCGSGNNGGDGFAIARMLHEEFSVRILWIGSTEKMSPETLANYKSVELLKIPCDHISEETFKNTSFKSDVILDCLIGTGGSENLRGFVADILKGLQNVEALKFAIDVPTGVNAETGATHESAFKSEYTITMCAAKIGMFLQNAPEYCGEIHIADIGAPNILLKDSSVKIIEQSDIRQILLIRNRNTSKFDYGRVAVIAGSRDMPGAVALTANAAISAGAGLVELFTPNIHALVMPEIMPHLVKSTDDGTIHPDEFEKLFKSIEKADVLAIGPGLGANEETISALQNFLKRVLQEFPEKKIVIDADGLKAVNSLHLNQNVILTPHIGEFARLLKIERDEVFKNSFELVKKTAMEMNCTILLKGATTIISNGRESYFKMTGNPGMATAGSGDVLTGIIAALCGQKVEPLEAAALGAFLHGASGDYYAKNYSQETLTATKIIENLENVLKDV
jgi:NAD(P)H-hydrate epimerase